MKDIVNSPLLVTLRRIVRTWLKINKANAKLNQLVDKYVVLPVLKSLEKIIPTDIDEIPIEMYEKVRAYTLPLIQEKADALLKKYPSYDWDEGLLQVGLDKTGKALKRAWNFYLRGRWNVDIVTVGRNKKTGDPGQRKVNIPESAQRRNPRLQKEAADIIRKDLTKQMVDTAFKQGMSVQGQNRMEKYLSERFKDTEVPLTDDVSVGSEAIAKQVFGDTSPNDYVRAQVLNDAQRQLKASKGGNEMPKTNQSNHPNWYTKGISSSLPVGLNFALRKSLRQIPGITKADGSSPYINNETPQIAQIAQHEVVLTVPSTSDTTWIDAMTILYKQIRAANSGARNYDASLLHKYIFNIRSLYVMYFTLKKLVALANNYDILDASKPNLFIETAIGLYGSGTADSITPKLLAELADIRTFGENLNSRLIHLFPAKCSLLDRTEWMFSNVFADSDDAKADFHQFAIFSGKVPYIKPDNTFDLADISRHTIVTNGLLSTFRTAINSVISALEQEPNIEVLTGDLIKAFGSTLALPKHDWSYKAPVPIIYDEAALSQIQNASIIGPAVNDAALLGLYAWNGTPGITTNGNMTVGNLRFLNLYTGPSFGATAFRWRDCVVNSHKDNLTFGEILSLTRLAANYTANVAIDNGAQTTKTITIDLETVGTEVIALTHLTGLGPSGDKMIGSVGGEISTFNMPKFDRLSLYSKWSNINWAPRIHCAYWADQTHLGVQGDVLDLNNYAYLSSANLKDFHSKACFSLVQFPNIVDMFSISALVPKSNTKEVSRNRSKERKYTKRAEK